MADNNNQRALNFEHGLKRSNIDKVSFRSSKADQVLLLDDIRELVAAAALDMYGGQDDPKYIYIVNLILKRIKATLNDIGLDASLKDIEQKLDDSISLSKEQLSVKSDMQTILSKSDKIYTKIHEYNELKKEEYDTIKTSLKLLLDANNLKKQSNDNSIALEKLATKEQLDVVMTQVNETLFKMTLLCNVAIPAINTRLDTLLTNIDTGFSTAMQNITNTSEVLNNAINDVDAGIRMTISNAEANIINAIGQSATTSIFGKISSIFSSVVSSAISKISGLFTKGFKAIGKTFSVLKNGIGKVFSATTESVKSSFFAAGKGIKKVFGAIGSLDFGIKGMFKKRTKGLKKMQSSIEDSISAMGSIVSGAMSAVMGPIGLVVNVMFGAFKVIMKPLKWFLGLFTNPIKLMLFLAGGMFILYKFFKPTFDKIVNKVSKIVEKAKDIYAKNVKPAVDIVKNIMGDSKLPLGKRIMTAATEGGKALYNNFFPNGIGAFFGDLWSNTLKPGISKLWSDVILPGLKGKVLPFLKDTVWPFVKSNWKPILAGIGMAWLIGNPLGPIKAILTAIKGISIAIKIATVTGKVIKSGLGIAKGAMSLLSALGPPGWIAIAIVSAVALIAYGLYKALDSAKKEAQDAGKELYVRISARDTEIQNKLNSISENQNKMFDEFGDVLEKAGIKKPEELSPQVYELEDGTLVGKDQIDAMILKVNAKKNSAIELLDKYMQDGGFEDLDRHAAFSLIAVFNSYYALARALVASVRSTLNAYAKDPVLQNDANLLKRYTAAQNIITKTESFVATEFAKLKELTHGTTMGMLKSLALSSTTDKTRLQGQQLIDNIKSQLQQALVTMVQLDDSGKTAVAGVNAKKLASEMLNNIDAKVEGAIESKDLKVIQDMIDGANATLSTIGTRMNAALKAQEKDVDKFLKETGLDKQNTTVANEMKELLKKLSDVATHAHMAKHGILKLDKETSRQIYEDAMLKLYKQKKEQLAKNPNDVALKKVVESLEKNLVSIKQHKDFTDQTSLLKGNLEKELAANNLDLTKEDANVKEGIDAALKQSFTKGDLNGISDIKQMSKDKQQAFLEDMKKQLAGQKVDDKKTEKIMEALNKLLTNTEEIKNKPTGDVTVVNSTTNVKLDKNLAGLDA